MNDLFYTEPNFETKQQLANAIAKGERVTVMKWNQDVGLVNGSQQLRGPQRRAGTGWYASATVVDNQIVAIEHKGQRITLPETIPFAEPYAIGEPITGYY